MKIYNTLTRQKEEFTAGDPVRMYVCGVTPYDDCHLGHALSYSTFDTIKRYLEFRGYRVKHVQNFTDVDDKIIDRSRLRKIPIGELSSRYIESYFSDMDRLNIKRADHYPRATQEIPEMIKVITALVEKGYAYEGRGSVYFRVAKAADYGKLSGHDPTQMDHAGAKEPGKESHLDFALWKASKPDEPCWESPWGKGRPGWHIECTAMSMRHLGTTLDIHGGGRDLIFPHHENELAQSECYSGIVPFARFWVHNGMVQVGEEKMSKSLGNLVTVKQLLQTYHSDAIRLLIASSHYRNPLTYSEDGLTAAEKGVERLRSAAGREGKRGGNALAAANMEQRFVEAMDDDFNAPQAVAGLFDAVREINKGVEDSLDASAAQKMLRKLCGVLGLTLAHPTTAVNAESIVRVMQSLGKTIDAAGHHDIAAEANSYVESFTAGAGGQDGSEAVKRLIEMRRRLRAAKQWHLADSVRSSLADAGVILEDTPEGTVWKVTRS
ncbi:MAG: cysteine--tRNA ligase [Chloroflexi bacterium]|nr:cysteine--tRNA ligase [Chloroflexota bacterium]